LDASFAGEDVRSGGVEEEDVGAAFYEVVEGYAVLIVGEESKFVVVVGMM